MKRFACLVLSERKCLELINLKFFSLSEAVVVCCWVFESRCFSSSLFRDSSAKQKESFAQIHCKSVLSLVENYIQADEKFTRLSNLPWQHHLTKAFLIADPLMTELQEVKCWSSFAVSPHLSLQINLRFLRALKTAAFSLQVYFLQFQLSEFLSNFCLRHLSHRLLNLKNFPSTLQFYSAKTRYFQRNFHC